MCHAKRSVFSLALCVVVISLLACGKSETPPAQQASTPKPAAPTPTPPPAPALKVTAIDLGNQIGADKKVMQLLTSFAPKDTIYVSVVTDGAASNATLTAKWTYEDGQVVNESTQAIAPTGPTTTEFHISKPDGWPTGKYKVEVSLNGQSAGTKEFEVKG